MLQRIFYTFPVILMILTISACQPTTPVLVTAAPTRTVASDVEIAVETAVTIFPTMTSTKIIADTSTPLPSETPTVEPTQRPSPTSTPEFYDVPQWISDPDTNILLINTTDRRGRNSFATLVNVETGERFDIPIVYPNSPQWWPQTDEGLYVHLSSSINVDDPHPVIYGVHIKTGEVRKFEYPSMINNAEDDTNEEDIEQELEEVVDPYDPFDGAYPDGTDVRWSSDGQMFAVGKYRWVEDESEPYGTRTEVGLGIYAIDGTFIAQYETLNSRAWEWSPAQPNRILYFADSNDSYIPCVWDVTTGNDECINEIANWRDVQGVKAGLFKWSPDSNKIGFISWGDLIGFCYIDLSTREIDCPIAREDLLVEEYSGFTQDGVAWLWFVNYFWSPDMQYVALVVNAAPTESDDHTLTSTSVIDLLDDDYLLAFPDGKLVGYKDPWRPPIQDRSQINN